MARHFGVATSTVYRWTLCPPERVIALESLSGVSRSALRPDLYPEPASPAFVSGSMVDVARRLEALASELRDIAARPPA